MLNVTIKCGSSSIITECHGFEGSWQVTRKHVNLSPFVYLGKSVSGVQRPSLCVLPISTGIPINASSLAS